MLYTAKGKPVDSGPKAWLFVLRDRTIFATDKKTDPPRSGIITMQAGSGGTERSVVAPGHVLVRRHGIVSSFSPFRVYYLL